MNIFRKKLFWVVGIGALIVIAAGLVMSGSSKTQQPATAKSSAQTHTSATDPKLQAVQASLKQQYSTINDSYIVTKDRDPDQGFGQSGYYNAGLAFCDTPNTLKEPADSVIAGSASNAYGYSCGGVIEVYSNEADVAKRVAYFDSNKTNPELSQCKTVNAKEVCTYKQVGDVFLHISDQYPANQWTTMLDYLSHEVQSEQL